LPPTLRPVTFYQNSALLEDKKTLTRNISCLYRTAVEELERKNKLIQQQARPVDNRQGGGRRASGLSFFWPLL
jgi:hypothetical protein